ncbi:MAG: UDP-glucose/GDP-mannose dehydrogenase family protein [Hyphomicrobiales bacterium]|nr:MAG: UDP-glucose/GDP-mannose dehydrogenase family protein [Hyphomicrobiales bacterium]
MNPITISVFGAGYVGCVSAACLVQDGYQVIAVDPDTHKIESLAKGIAPIYEPGLDQLIAAGHQSGALSATPDYVAAVMASDVSFCCPGTPSREDGSLDTKYVQTVSEQIGQALKQKDDFHVVVMRSTILPGTVESIVIPALEKFSGKKAGVDFGVAYYPEFLREGTAVADYYSPGAIVFGELEGDVRSIETLKSLCAHIPVEPHVIPIRSAEMIKYANNCWHAVKIGFANEIGNLCKSVGIDSHVVMDVVCADTRLNISSAYLKPGYAFGGSCLPKDLRALRSFGRVHNTPTPMLEATIAGNAYQIEKAYRLIRRTGKRKVGLLGITFKSDTDDLRESPYLALAERLLGSGYDLSIYDQNVSAMENGGRNFVPHLAPFIRSSAGEVIDAADTVVIGNKDEDHSVAFQSFKGSKVVVDLARLPDAQREGIEYIGLSW